MMTEPSEFEMMSQDSFALVFFTALELASYTHQGY